MAVPLRLLFLLGCTAYLSGVSHAQGAVGDDDILIKPDQAQLVKALGVSAMLTCEAVNVGDGEDPGLRWYDPNGRLIRETSGRVYVWRTSLTVLKLYLTDIQPVDAGLYQCNGTVNNKEQYKRTRLFIFKDITWIDAPQTQNPKINTNALIKCIVTASPSPEVTWWKAEQRIHTGGRYTQQADGLAIRNIKESDNAVYRCQADVPSRAASQSRFITVEVHIPPVITREPGKVEGIAGREVILSCEATGRPKPLFVWYKGTSTEPIMTGDRFFVDEEFGRLKIKILRKEDSGKYRCEATNTVGRHSGNASLDVLIPPFVVELLNKTKNENEDASLVCRTEGNPVPAMSWRKVGSDKDMAPGVQPGDSRIEVRSGGDNNLQLIIKNLVPEDSSNYTCKAKNKVGYIAANGTVTVLYKPNFKNTPMSKQYLWRNKKRNLTCIANGNPEPSWEWIHNGEAIEGNFKNQTHRLITIGRLSHLEIYVPFEDPESFYREYYCKAYNGLGSNQHMIFLERATVPDAPESAIISSDTPTKVMFSVRPPKNNGGEPIQGYTIRYDGQILNFKLDQEMRVINLNPETLYTFEVSARTEVGIGTPISISHKTKARQRPGLLVFSSEVIGTEPFKYTLRWEEPESGGFFIKTFHIKYRRVSVLKNTTIVDKGLGPWKTLAVKNDNDANPMRVYEFKNLDSDSYYQTEVAAENDLGKGDASPFVFKTAYSKDPESGESTGSASSLCASVLVALLSSVAVFLLRA